MGFYPCVGFSDAGSRCSRGGLNNWGTTGQSKERLDSSDKALTASVVLADTVMAIKLIKCTCQFHPLTLLNLDKARSPESDLTMHRRS